jgi:hypothetical protein
VGPHGECRMEIRSRRPHPMIASQIQSPEARAIVIVHSAVLYGCSVRLLWQYAGSLEHRTRRRSQLTARLIRRCLPCLYSVPLSPPLGAPRFKLCLSTSAMSPPSQQSSDIFSPFADLRLEEGLCPRTSPSQQQTSWQILQR